MIDKIESLRVIPVVAIDNVEDALPLAEALTAGGLPVAEITLRTDAGIAAISKMAELEGFLVGAGTVHSADQAKQVVDAGAKFIVSPGFNPRTVQWCLDHAVPIFPGISSPTDLESAIELGINVVKFFPAEQIGGVKMLKALQGPYGEIRFIPTGGINVDNLGEYLSLPSVVACGGSWMVKPDLIRSKNFEEIQRLTRDAVQSL
ncbi:2-dehydro-3-deoxyphosphogluconate aldolase/(4S)-4-hydroxy-2-oxoglutarate aldolase [Rhodopirellula rubra]|uniref:2-dehydro-3-deoxy-phosphogluconate aldolase n=1 Tax=Aporhodopirellula rubra TaxID=980271 RepID=A0A7W5H5S5_9BACT|nr:bifunctional 4-hydroxy-2-oxoglutarate aldolase/2-dehydro-3-deoxy-phosphogluconate aldolase [Aporhodopirellula rubra]MBB3206739.1 2-dehydro-3-deoxyphosphogluconate aldolase/(4S)-4-hydroxy-2-oxoglutarate aldolase [Aporhodopirellula rubra]